jgi:hypothetical protein
MLNKVVGAVVALALFVGLPAFVYALSNNLIVIGYNKGYAPDQPIPFSHELHAGKYGIDCQYCHQSVEVSRHATVPATSTCMNCHQFLVMKPDSQWLNQIRAAHEKNESIPWQKVHLLPDHVKFNHAAHVAAGKQCAECHGPVETMPVVYQHSSLSMGWCLECHRKPENQAPVNCGTCHY